MSKTAIVIGTGASGLTAAVGLAQAGFEVTALEREKQLGGFLNPFQRRHFHFDPGVHYVGQCDPGGDMYRVLERCGVDATALMAPMDPDCVDMLRFPGVTVKMPASVDGYRDHLVSLFPEDREDIDKCFRTMRAFAPVLRSQESAAKKLRGLPQVARLATMSFGSFLESTFKNPKLRAILGAQCGDYGVPPSRAPALLGLGVVLHYTIGGGFFPRGGSGELRDALVEAGRELGVVYKRRTAVETIHTERGRVTGVTTAKGEHLTADVIISTIDPTLTYGRLLNEDSVPGKLRRKASETLPSVGSLCLYYGIERDLREDGLGAFNVWDYPTWDVESAFAYALDGGEMPEDFAFFLSPNSLKDDTNRMAPEGCSTLEVVTLAPFAPFAKWADGKALKRGDEYDALKQESAERLKASVDARWPGLISDVVIEDVSTPVTNIHFAGAVAGGIYGPAAVREQFGLNAFRRQSPIDGLYLAGAGVDGPGVAPCLASGMKSARAAAKASEKKVGWLPSLLQKRRPRLA